MSNDKYTFSENLKGELILANINSPFKFSLNVYLSLLILSPPNLTILIFN